MVAKPTDNVRGATYVGVAPEPAETRIFPAVELATNLPQVVGVFA